MKKNITALLTILLCVLLIICIFQISSLNKKIEAMEKNQQNYYQRLETRISNIYSNIGNILDEQDNLVVSKDFEYGNFDMRNMSVKTMISVVPKEYNYKKTKVYLVTDDKTIPMKIEDGKYVCNIYVPIIEGIEIDDIQFIEDENVRMQKMKWGIHPREKIFPHINAFMYGTYRGTNEYSCVGTIKVEVKGTENNKIEKISLVEVLDGKDIDYSPIILYKDEDKDNTINLDEISANFFHGNYEIDETYNIPDGSIHELYVELTDSFGFNHRVLVDTKSLKEEQNDEYKNDVWPNVGAKIYNSSGDLIFDPYENYN